MEETAYKWKKPINGNEALKNVRNPLRNFIEKVLPSIPLNQYPERPQERLNLSIGDPTASVEYRTIKQNLEQVAKSLGKVDGYTDVQGLKSAREAIIKKFGTKSHHLTQDDVYLTLGGSLALWTAMNLLANERDNYLTPSPGFPLTTTIANSMGLQPRLYHLQHDKNWQPNLQELQSLIDQRTKFILVNDPSNPLGSVWSAKIKREIIGVCIKHKINILADQIYEQMSYVEQVPTFAQLVLPEEVDKVAIYKCSGLTKRYLVPGWRMGWLILYADQQKQKAMRNYLRGIFNVTLMPTTIVQYAIPAILQNQNNDKRMKECMDKMHLNIQALKNGLEGEEYCSFGDSSGALYSTIILHNEKFKGRPFESAFQFVKLFYASQNVMVFPENFFAGEVPFIRLVVSCELKKIEQFLVRFKKFCRRLIAE